MIFIYQWIMMTTACVLLDSSLGNNGQKIVSDVVFLTGLLAGANILWALGYAIRFIITE